MKKTSMALSCRCVASLSCRRAVGASFLFRSFSTNNSLLEDIRPKIVPPRVQARLDAGEAFQDLARRRSENGGSSRHRSIPAQELSQATFPGRSLSRDTQTASSFRSSGPRTLGSRTFGPHTTRPGQTSDRPTRPQRPGVKNIGRNHRDSRNRVKPWAKRETAVEEEEVEEDMSDAEMTEQEHAEYLKSLGHVENFVIKPHPGPHLEMAGMMMEYAPKHFGATEPVSGKYPALTDSKRRGLLQDIVRSIRKNETYTEKDIDQMAKKLGPLMPRS